MTIRAHSAAALAVASIFLLSGCSFSFGAVDPLTVSSDDLADLAEEALEDEFEDSKWKVDCDDDGEEFEVELTKGETIDCLATNKDTKLEYDAEVEITKVKGDEYEIEVELADEANNADEFDDDDRDSDSNGDAYYVSAADLAAVAAGAVEEIVGYVPSDMECLYDEIELYVDNVNFCWFTDGADKYYSVDVTVASINSKTGEYTVNVEVFE